MNLRVTNKRTGQIVGAAVVLTLAGAGGAIASGDDDEESQYEVGVTLDNGHRVDVQLDEAFTVVATEGEDGSGDEGS